MKLKTLKDIRVPYMYTTKDFAEGGAIHLKIIDEKAFVNVNELQDVAREWIDEIDRVQYKDAKGKWEKAKIEKLNINCGEYSCDNIKEWIKHFFNLE